MRAELSVIKNNGEAITFGLGCLIACVRFHLELNISPKKHWSGIMKDRFAVATFTSGLLAVGIGLAYLFASGAPLSMLIVNGAAMLIGITLVIGLRVSARITDSFITMVTVIGAFSLMGTAIFGYASEDARRWLLIGPFFVQTSLIFLPLIAIGFARVHNFWTSLAIFVAALAMAFQPDRAMAAMLFVAVAIVGLMRPNKLTYSASMFCAVTFATTLFLPDRLPAVPFVDHILWTAFDAGFLRGLSLWAGCLLLVCPIFFVPKGERTVLHYTFTSCWLALIAAAAVGAYPTPIVGYGASAIIGYFLGLIFIQSTTQAAFIGDNVRTSLPATDDAVSPLRNSAPSFAI